MRIGIVLGSIGAVACSPGAVIATLSLEGENGDMHEMRLVADAFHDDGEVSIASDDGERIELRLLVTQPGRYATPLTVAVDGATMEGAVQLDVELDWNDSGRYPFTHRVRFAGGQVSDGETPFRITAGGFTIRGETCRTDDASVVNEECGHTWDWEDDRGAEVRYPLEAPAVDKRLLADLCPDALATKWLNRDTVVMTSDQLDLGREVLPCVKTGDGRRACGAVAYDVSADGCDDWHVTWLGYPQGSGGDSTLRLQLSAGAVCGSKPRTCRSTWSATSFEER